ncbi:hypothetical protein JTB14_010247 [Gonioctena quinquepunctata]|nr:hypothetical protein JTB14_010247 [Gonioctena quinquepunctata]
MDWKWIENMDSENLYDSIDTLSVDDKAAVFSECRGDSDAEDGKILENLQKKNHLTRDSTSETGFCEIESENESINDFDSDDSIADPNFVMEKDNEDSFRTPGIDTDSSEAEDELEKELTEEISAKNQRNNKSQRNQNDNIKPMKWIKNLFGNLILAKTLRSFQISLFHRKDGKYSPKDLVNGTKKLKIGESKVAMAEDISFTAWKDRGSKPVLMVNSIHDPQTQMTVRRTNKEGKKQEIACPICISDYNKYMNGVDHFDQFMQNYYISRKSRRWWIKIF